MTGNSTSDFLLELRASLGSSGAGLVALDDVEVSSSIINNIIIIIIIIIIIFIIIVIHTIQIIISIIIIIVIIIIIIVFIIIINIRIITACDKCLSQINICIYLSLQN